jgi:Uma2 family endonuclease
MRPSVTYINEFGSIEVPDWVVDLESFRRWLDADDLPENLRIWWLCGKVWIDMTKEQLFTHLAVKNQFNIVLGLLAEKEERGLFFPDGLLVSNEAGNIGGNPDATFVTYATLEAGRVRLVEGMEEGLLELEGSPDVVLEVVSRSSIQKDKEVLRQAYWRADIPEYWLVDALTEPLTFDILKHTGRGYVAARKRDGWLKSDVFGKSFRLTRRNDRKGFPQFKLEVR